MSCEETKGNNVQKAVDQISADLKASGEQQKPVSHTRKAQTKSVTASAADNVDSNQSTPNNSQNNSPTKSTPSKSARKRKSDAKKRNANSAKQKNQPKSDTGQDGKTKVNVVGKPSTIGHSIIDDKFITPVSDNSAHSFEVKEDTLIPNSSNITLSATQMEQDPLQKENSSANSRTDFTEELNDKQDRVTETDSLVTQLNQQPEDGHDQSNEKCPKEITVMPKYLEKKQREMKELREQLKLKDAHTHKLMDKMKQQIYKIKELENSLVSTTRACSQFEGLLQQELANRTRLENENESLDQLVVRLKNQINSLEKERATNDELIRTLNATLMERETEVSILKLKMTRLQTSQPVSSVTINRATLKDATSCASVPKSTDPIKAFAISGRSNSEFSRNSYARSSMIAEVAASTRSSTSQLQKPHTTDKDALVWAKVPEELTPSKRPLLLDRNSLIGSHYNDQNQMAFNNLLSQFAGQSSTPLYRDSRMYRTLPRSIKSPEAHTPKQDSELTLSADQQQPQSEDTQAKAAQCLVTNLDDSNSTNQSGSGARSTELDCIKVDANKDSADRATTISRTSRDSENPTINKSTFVETDGNQAPAQSTSSQRHAKLPARSSSSPVKISSGLKRIFSIFRQNEFTTSPDESQSKSDVRDPPLTVSLTPSSGPFQRGGTRSTMLGLPGTATSSKRELLSTKPFAEWDNDMLVEWLTTIGLSMYANQCRRWVKCGAHIMNATPAEVDKGLGITNHLHRKKLRLAISELNGDCDKVTKAASRLDYLWVARWLDDIGLPQYKETFINARVDGRVLNYLTVDDLFSMNIKSALHHSSIKCGIRVLRSINFDLQSLKRRATADEVEQMSSIRQRLGNEKSETSTPEDNQESDRSVTDTADISLWTCHRVMEWLRMIDFAEFAPNLRGSGIHGGLIVFEDGFTIETISSLLGIPSSRTLLRRHLATFFDNLIGQDLVGRKRRYKTIPSNEPLDHKTNLKAPKRNPLWFNRLKSSRVGQDGMDEYLCPMYPVEPQLIKSPLKRKQEVSVIRDGSSQLPRIPESINV